MKRGNSFIATKLRWRNFMSFGDNETELDLTGQDIAVLLGENLDSASEDARNGVGKSQPLDSKVLTPDGWRPMGELQLNDKVTTSGGRAARIAGITDQPEPLPGFAIRTVDGRRTRCSGDHNWYVLTTMKKPRNLNTFFSVEDDEPLQWRTLTTEAILLGLESDHEFYLPLHQPPRTDKFNDDDPWHTGMVVENDYGTWRPRAYNAPQRYMYLKGLLGYHKKGKNATMPSEPFCKEVRVAIADEVQKTVWALGGYCRRKTEGLVETVEIEVQNPNHKRREQLVKIQDVFMDSGQEAMRCLVLAGGDPLYVTDDYIVTHNSTIIDALCFVLFGKTIRGVPNARLVNKWVPKKPMYVELEFQKGDWQYMIERGERPSKLKLFRKPLDEKLPFKKKEGRKFVFDISRGKTETTGQIMELLGYNITLFEYLVANSSESDPFPVLKPPQQRDVIEKLFGFEIMSLKGGIISEERKETRKALAVAETELSTIIQANERIRAQIAEVEQRSKAWERGYHQRLEDLRGQIATLSNIDYDLEIENLRLLADIEAENSRIEGELSQARRTKMSAEQMLSTEKRMEKTIAEKVTRLEHEVKHVAGGVCPTCKQSWNTEESQYRAEQLSDELCEAAGSLENQKVVLTDCQAALDEAEEILAASDHELHEFNEMLENMDNLEVNFDTVEQAMEAKNRITHLQSNLEAAEAEVNPFLETKKSLETEALQPEDDSEVKRLRKLLKHQDFMVKMLTDSNSFVRKQILDQWVPALNKQIQHYMTHFDKPHKVAITPELHMEISLHQEQYIWKEMSKGERVSTILSTNMAFQDIFEYMNYGINILCIDELLDNGLGPGEARSVLEVLKRLNHTKRKSILLITHRDDIAAQADRTFVAKKANDISWVEQVQ